jgi:hypothetical protein
MLSVMFYLLLMLNVVRYVEYLNVECHYDEYRGAQQVYKNKNLKMLTCSGVEISAWYCLSLSRSLLQ